MDDIPSLCSVFVLVGDLLDLVLWHRRKEKIFGCVKEHPKLPNCLGDAVVVVGIDMDACTNKRDHFFLLVGSLEIFDTL